MLICKLTLFTTSLLTSCCLGQKVKIMLIGDSITEITCWRSMVWSQLQSAGLSGNVDFVGSMNGIPSSCTQVPSNFDANHEGHSGWQAVDIAKNNIAGWMQQSQPDIVQFMLGTNDINIGKRSPSEVLDAYTSMLGTMRSVKPGVEVVIDKIMPTRWNDQNIEAINSAIPAWVQQHSTAQSPIIIADCSRDNGFTDAMFQSDGVHPNDAGSQFIASQVGPKLIQFIRG